MRFRDRIDHVSAGGVGFEEQVFLNELRPAGVQPYFGRKSSKRLA
jgi:hypothetical protein